jgi:hypothetical protein
MAHLDARQPPRGVRQRGDDLVHEFVLHGLLLRAGADRSASRKALVRARYAAVNITMPRAIRGLVVRRPDDRRLSIGCASASRQWPRRLDRVVAVLVCRTYKYRFLVAVSHVRCDVVNAL